MKLEVDLIDNSERAVQEWAVFVPRFGTPLVVGERLFCIDFIKKNLGDEEEVSLKKHISQKKENKLTPAVWRLVNLCELCVSSSFGKNYENKEHVMIQLLCKEFQLTLPQSRALMELYNDTDPLLE
jgi:hypothetical protein